MCLSKEGEVEGTKDCLEVNNPDGNSPPVSPISSLQSCSKSGTAELEDELVSCLQEMRHRLLQRYCFGKDIALVWKMNY